MTKAEDKKYWRQRREEIKADILAMIQGDHEICKHIRETAFEMGMKENTARFRSFYDSNLAASIAIACSHLATMTDGDFVEEGNRYPYMNMAGWAGYLMEQTMMRDLAAEMKERLGMGNN